MGYVVSKLFRNDTKTTKNNEEKQTEDSSTQTVEILDVRSPTLNIIRTPIIVEKLKQELSSKNPSSPPLRTKLLKNLKLDPRSPTVGIHRTPILVEDSISDKENFDSPVSIYSCNISDSILQDIMTPIEPSINVSDFEVSRGKNELDNTLEPKVENEVSKVKGLQIVDKPSTYEGRRLLEDIMAEEENIRKAKNCHKKENKVESSVVEKKSLYDVKGRSRPPLTNITLSTNSPNAIKSGGKLHNRNRILTKFDSENPSSPKVKHLAEWDQNNTVII